MTDRMPEPGRQAAHILLDMVVAHDNALGDSDANWQAMTVAFQRLNEVDAAVATYDDETDEIALDASGLIGGAVVSMKWLVGHLAVREGRSEEEVVADLRAFHDSQRGA